MMARDFGSQSEERLPPRLEQAVAPARKLHIVLTVNASWNLVNFRSGLIRSLIADGHRVTALAPRDAQTPVLEAMGCGFIELEMDSKGISIGRDAVLLGRFVSVFRRERPDVVFGYTIKNNIYGALAARILGIPFLPNVTGLGTAFMRDGPLNRTVRQMYRVAFRSAPVVSSRIWMIRRCSWRGAGGE